jgi:hypothetical protein
MSERRDPSGSMEAHGRFIRGQLDPDSKANWHEALAVVAGRKRTEWLCRRIKSLISFSSWSPTTSTLDQTRIHTHQIQTVHRRKITLVHLLPMFLTLKLAPVPNFGPPVALLPFSTTVLRLQ